MKKNIDLGNRLFHLVNGMFKSVRPSNPFKILITRRFNHFVYSNIGHRFVSISL